MKIDRQKVYEKYFGHCAYCGRDIKFKEMQVDHIKPKCQRWNDLPLMIDSFENLNPSCRRCNHYKRSLSLEQFRERINTLHKRLEKIYIVRVAMNFGIVETKCWDGLFYFENKMSIKEFVQARQK